MPQAFDNPFSGLSRGLRSSFDAGLAFRQQKLAEIQAEKERTIAEEQRRMNRLLTGVKLNSELLATPGLPQENKQQFFNNILASFKQGADLLGIDPEAVPVGITLQDGTDKFAKELSTLINTYQVGKLGDPNSPEAQSQLRTGLLGIASRFQDTLSTSEALNLAKEVIPPQQDGLQEQLKQKCQCQK